MTDTHLKEKVLVRTSWISAIGNLILSVLKITVGLLAGSMAVLGDGIDSATDVVISIVMIFTAGIVNRPPTQKYIYGYKKAESIATKILSLIIFYAGVQMFFSSIKALFSDETRELPQRIAIYVTVFSIIGKLLLAWYQRSQGERINSPLLIANAVNMRNDVLISISVLLGLLFTYILDIPVLDVVTGLFISLVIIKSAIDIFKESNVELMDGVKDEKVYEDIFQAVELVKEARNPHRVRSRQIGNLYMIALDIEVDGNMTLWEAHQVSDEVEAQIRRTVANVYDIVVHVEPVERVHNRERFGVSQSSLKCCNCKPIKTKPNH